MRALVATREERLAQDLASASRGVDLELAWVAGLPWEVAASELWGARLLLLDADMGSGHVLHAARHARLHNPDLKVVVLISWWDERERDYAAVADGFLRVPARSQDLQALLATLGLGATQREPVLVA